MDRKEVLVTSSEDRLIPPEPASRYGMVHHFVIACLVTAAMIGATAGAVIYTGVAIDDPNAAEMHAFAQTVQDKFASLDMEPPVSVHTDDRWREIIVTTENPIGTAAAMPLCMYNLYSPKIIEPRWKVIAVVPSIAGGPPDKRIEVCQLRGGGTLALRVPWATAPARTVPDRRGDNDDTSPGDVSVRSPSEESQ